MRLDWLSIKSPFKNLNNFTINFDEDSTITVIVGRNGTGKSNLLEAITLIFRNLDLGESPAFKYELKYTCRGKRIYIDADPNRNPHKGYSIEVDDNKLSLSKFLDEPERAFLPNYIFGYYSGPSNRMEEHFVKHQELFYKDLLEGKDKPLRPLFFARPVQSQFVLLAFFMEQNEEVLKFLNEQLWIEGLDYAMFVMREPSWKSREGDPRFWKARGVVRDFLDHLYGLSLAPLRLTRRLSIGFRKTTSKEHLYLYLKDLKDIHKLANLYQSPQDLFKALESTYISELISEVRINVKARKVDGSLTFRELSEGEQQLLMVLGLLRFTREEESLFLLDEPDTHLNPAWSVQYLDFLKRIGGAQTTSHIVMATHDPLVIANLNRPQTQILIRDEETGMISAEQPRDDPWKMGVAALLTSEVYGLKAPMGLPGLQLLERKRELASQQNLSVVDAEELKDLTEKLGQIDFTVASRDPLYHVFVEAMTQRQHEEGLDQPVLTREEHRKLRRLAHKVLSDISEEGDKS